MEKWRLPLALLLSALLTACGGGGDSPAVTGPTTTTTPPPTQEPGAPTLTNNTATDGFNWFNYRRAQVGLKVLSRNSQIDTAAQGHSNYQRVNNTITHEQSAGAPGFTGATLQNRLENAGYALQGYSYRAGEVISATSNSSGFYQAEELIAAIYHRFVIFEPVFAEIGTGAATTSSNYTYFTADFAERNNFSGLGAGKFVVYPVNGQTGVPTNFFSDNESPDPVPNQNEVGYPISVHADNGSTVTVRSFTIAPRGGTALNVRLLSNATDAETTKTAAAIVPLTPLRGATVYDVSFNGAIDGTAVSRNWSFTTK